MLEHIFYPQSKTDDSIVLRPYGMQYSFVEISPELHEKLKRELKALEVIYTAGLEEPSAIFTLLHYMFSERNS